MLWGPLPSEGIVNSVTKPVVVIRPILLPTMQREPGSRMQLASVNHKAPSGPVVMPHGWAWGLGRANSVILPSVVMSWSRLSEQNLRVDKWSLCRG